LRIVFICILFLFSDLMLVRTFIFSESEQDALYFNR
jgi:hypothetical protein